VPELDLEVGAQLVASLGSLTKAIAREQQWRARQAEVIRQVPITAPQAGASGIIDSPDLLAVKTGYFWGVRRLTLSGFTAGTATIYLNSTSGEPVAPFPQAGVFTFSKGQLIMHPGDRLVVQATGITGYVQLNGAADLAELWYLPYYLG
jgi:hypothetical protein